MTGSLPPAAPRPAVRRLVRRRDGSVVAGVATGLAEHLGIDVRIVRVVFVVLNLLFGIGLLAYILLWLGTPMDSSGAAHTRRLPVQFLLVGAALVALGSLGLTGHTALPDLARPILPILAVSVGAVLAWSDVEAFERHSWLGPGGPRRTLPRVVAGVALAAIGFLVLMTSGQGLSMARDVAFATAAVIAGIGLVLVPWVAGFWRRYEQEQTARIRAVERADIAAHLHDSVLQTLALIQRTQDPARAARLARAQERELRAWLYGGPPPGSDTLAAAVERVCHEVEDTYSVPVELVMIGDRPLGEEPEALVRALREALLNAVRHGSPPVSAYVEVGASAIEAFVRDRGPGFDLAEVPPDRLGVRESIVGRMQRCGGEASIRRREDGTEVCLRMPLRPEAPSEASEASVAPVGAPDASPKPRVAAPLAQPEGAAPASPQPDAPPQADAPQPDASPAEASEVQPDPAPVSPQPDAAQRDAAVETIAISPPIPSEPPRAQPAPDPSSAPTQEL